jgi:hypothetical protein
MLLQIRGTNMALIARATSSSTRVNPCWDVTWGLESFGLETG